MRVQPAATLLALVVLLTPACTPGASGEARRGDGTNALADVSLTDPSRRELAKTACANVSHEALLRTWRGVSLDRSGEIQIIPKDPNFVNGGLTHATPFDYSQDVPLFLYGPGYVRPGEYERPVTLADVAPTLGALLKFPFDTADGDAQTQALLPEGARPLPRLVVALIWDSAGTDVL